MTSKANQAIRFAKEKGYTHTEDGFIMNPRGKAMCGHVGSYGYYMLGIFFNGKRMKVLAHRFIAYCVWGEVIFEHRLIRHLDGNQLNNRPDNLKPGSHHDNMMDMPRADRVARITKGNRTKALNILNTAQIS